MTSGASARHLAMTPNRAFATLMAVANRASYAAALANLSPPGNGRILEIGFGAGAWIERVLRRFPGCTIAGIDPTPGMLALAQSRAALRRAGARVELVCAGAESIPFPAGCFDAAVAIHSFQFWAEPDKALDGVSRVLRPGGRLVLVLRSHDGVAPAWLPNPISRSGAEVEGACAAIRHAGLAVLKIEQGQSFSVVCAVKSA